MEAILMDVKRVMRSLQGILHAVSGAVHNGVKGGVRRSNRYRAIGDGAMVRDLYGREGRPDLYSNREMTEYYKAVAFGKNPIL